MITIAELRQFRVGPYALFDLTVSYLGVYLLSPLLSKLFLKIRVSIPKLNWLFLTLPIALLAHLLIGQYTQMTKDLLDLHGHYLIKLIFVVSLLLGLRGIRITKHKIQ